MLSLDDLFSFLGTPGYVWLEPLAGLMVVVHSERGRRDCGLAPHSLRQAQSP